MAQPYAPMLQQMMLEFQNKRLESAERIARSILRINPKDLVALQIQGLCMAMQGRIVESIEPFSKAASIDNKNPEILTNLGKAQHQSQRFSEAITTFEKLNRLIPNNAQILADLGTAYAKLRIYDKASVAYEKAISLNPNYFLVFSNQGNLLADQGYPERALISYEKAIQLNPAYAESWTNYGNALFDLGRFDDACKAHDQSLACDPYYAEAWFNKANCLTELKEGEQSLDYYSKAFAIKADIPYLLGQLINALATNCSWGQYATLIPKALQNVEEKKPAVAPFILLQTPANLALQKQAAEIYVRDRVIYINPNQYHKTSLNKDQRIRIGYFSTDFKEHPVGILMENIIKLHDRSSFEVIGYFLNKKSGDALEGRLTSLFDKTHDLFGVHDQDAQKLVEGHDLDIAIDLNGHTAGARTGLFARKIAPVQINYLGYAATMGASFYDYLITDSIAVPHHDQIHFSEQLAYLPNSFFPADTLIDPNQFESLPSRSSQGLPQDGFVFASFNNSYKITPEIFEVWMRLLKDVPKSVLWLSSPSKLAKQNLQNTAQKLGVDSDRLVFASREPTREGHLSRLRLAELFLDTPFFNAHTTAADALWSGVPVLTQIGMTFASRVAASQLYALDMPELITESQDEYFAKAIHFANNPHLLGEVRQKLEANRFVSPLFNTKQYIADLEALYRNLINEKATIN